MLQCSNTRYAQVNVVVEEDGWQEEGNNCATWPAARVDKKLLGIQNIRLWAGRHLIPLIIPFAIFLVICFVPSTEFFLCDLPRIHPKYISSCQGKKWVK